MSFWRSLNFHRHAGLDPASRFFFFGDEAGPRIKPGVTNSFLAGFR
jgi:hypothetical protein